MSATPSQEALNQLDLRYRLTAMAAKAYLQAGFSVVVQDNYYGDKLPTMLELLAPEPARAIVLCPDPDTIQKREQARGKRGYTGFSVEDLYRSFMESTPRIGFWLDNSRLTPEQTVDKILEEVVL